VGDPIAFVEACYDLRATNEAWLRAIANVARPLLRVDEVLAYHIDPVEGGFRFDTPVSTASPSEALARVQDMARLLQRKRTGRLSPLERLRAHAYENVVRRGLAEPADHMLLSEIRTYGPRWMYTLGVPRVRELIHLINHHIDGNGVTMLIGPRLKSEVLRPSERSCLQMLSAHLKAGFRLRRRLAECGTPADAPPDGAVLDASSRVVHAEGEARSAEARESLAARAREIDRARTHAGGRNDDALAVWQGLVDGRWSLVERFDADGRRHLLAHRNPEDVADPRGLSDLEARVIGLVARGYSDKLVAYHLGISEGAVAARLARALRKLGFARRVDLVRTLGAVPPRRRPRRDELDR
jgi:DNA-binding CsgD family transcriptional regulator